MLIPPFALFRGLQLLNKQAVTWETLTPDHELSATFGYLILASVLFFLLDMYASQVLPREFGIRQPWNFPCLKVYSFLRERRRKLKRLSALERRRSHASMFQECCRVPRCHFKKQSFLHWYTCEGMDEIDTPGIYYFVEWISKTIQMLLQKILAKLLQKNINNPIVRTSKQRGR